ncbi:hypothetical protein [Streptomyces sp. Da 82-17]|uniref:hypothetical protein n=1 Tax=Streptomyces sp. Da 82-17 TaxID=3377116 RepID=UPI0038D4F9CD
MAAQLVATVYVTDPDSHQTVVLEEGSEPEPRLAALVTNPAAWENGTLPGTRETGASSEDDGDKQAARKPAAKKPARSRSAADEGTSGE